MVSHIQMITFKNFFSIAHKAHFECVWAAKGKVANFKVSVSLTNGSGLVSG